MRLDVSLEPDDVGWEASQIAPAVAAAGKLFQKTSTRSQSILNGEALQAVLDWDVSEPGEWIDPVADPRGELLPDGSSFSLKLVENRSLVADLARGEAMRLKRSQNETQSPAH